MSVAFATRHAHEDDVARLHVAVDDAEHVRRAELGDAKPTSRLGLRRAGAREPIAELFTWSQSITR
jgi:hypothetical protein